jgi:hypothetical protein
VPLRGNELAARHIIEALSTTPSAPVRNAFENLATSFPESSVGKAASAALSGLDRAARIPEAPTETRSGDLETFGLPVLIQGLAEPVSGLRAQERSGRSIEIVLRGSRMKSCETGGLAGEKRSFSCSNGQPPAHTS